MAGRKRRISPTERLRVQEEARLVAGARLWITSRFEGQGCFTKVEHASYRDCLAYEAAFGDGRTMIYAVTAGGRSIHIDSALAGVITP